MLWTLYTDPKLQEAALALARGSYQRDLLLGSEAWSGSTLKGKAKQWGASYNSSRNELLKRLTAAGIPHAFDSNNPSRRKILIIGVTQEEQNEANTLSEAARAP